MNLDTTPEIKYILRLEEKIDKVKNNKYKSFGSYSISAKEMKEIRDSIIETTEELIKDSYEIIELKNMVKDLQCKTPKPLRYIDRRSAR